MDLAASITHTLFTAIHKVKENVSVPMFKMGTYY